METPTKDTRKPASDLSPIDMAVFPIWEYVMDETQFDETYVRPVCKARVPNNGELYHLGMELRTTSGVVRPGCVEIFDGEYRFPMTFLRNELCDLEPRVIAVDEWRRQMETVFGLPLDDIFPLQWKLSAPHGNKRRSGRGKIVLTPSNACRFEEDDV
ncbi:MAG: hypothetical protein SF172_17735 [Burkholderiales bacterium]|nr:hypothetical protein [Burkholderiales bacterium]